MIRHFVSFIAVLLVLIIVLLNRLSDFDISEYERSRILSFKYQNNLIEGTLILPPDKVEPPFVILVHGDGPQDRWSESGYIPLVKFLVSQGIAVFSWDKPGVGKSSGNWLAQTMSDRAEEAASAMRILREQPELKGSRGGYLGFSQAGWVVPKASQMAPTDFIVLIGAAINWRNQSVYFTQERFKSQGYSMVEVQSAKKYKVELFDQQFTEKTAVLPCASRCTRKDFERKNSLTDVTKDIPKIHAPVLVLMGSDDRNVDPDETIFVWLKELPTGIPKCIRKIEGATHGLLRSKWFDYQLPADWPLSKQGLFLLSGKFSYVPEALDTISSWIQKQECRD